MGTDILDRFIEAAKKNVESGYYETPAQQPTNNRVSLKEKLVRDFSLIAEIKHASPAGEYSFNNIDAEKTALAFRDAGADAISVVVEPQIFKGSLNDIVDAKKAGLPVLFKDFVIDAQQINVAAELGADCVLLIAKVADRLGLDINSLIDLVHSLGMEVLLECFDESEMQNAIKTDADILGINNRDLQTLKVDLNRTREILQCIGKSEKPVISESGIRTRKDVEFVKSFGVKGILVGTALWTAKNQTEKIKELKGVD